MGHQRHQSLNTSTGSDQGGQQRGFSLIAVIGILAVVTIGLSLISPAMVRNIDRRHQETERSHLQRIAEGIHTYLEQNKAFPPSLTSLIPDYSPFPTTQLTTNAHGYPRYYAVHPTLLGFTNTIGLSAAQLVDTRFLIISNLTQDAAPLIATPIEFETWWGMDESAMPGLLMYRGEVGNLFYQLTIDQDGVGGSYQLNGSVTNSGGGTLPFHTRYHLKGTPVQFDEADTYGTPNLQFALTSNTTYWFDPNCTAGKQWNAINPDCGCALSTLSIVNPGFETGTLTGWTKTGDISGNGGTNEWGSVTSAGVMPVPKSGTYFSSGEATGATGGGTFAHSTGLYQRINISPCATAIDANKINLTIQGYGFGQGSADQSYMAVKFFDAVSGGTQVGSQINSNITNSWGTWATLALNNTPIPPNTRSIELHLIGRMTSTGFWVDSGFDDLSGLLTIVP